MKKTKKLLALALALMLSLSCMAMPAMAMQNGSARVSMICQDCLNYADFTSEGIYTWDTRTVGGCAATNFTHQHKYGYWYRWLQCSKCDHRLDGYAEPPSEEKCLYKG